MVGAVGFDDFDDFSFNTMQPQEFASNVDCKTRAVFSEKMKPLKVGGSVEGGIDIAWDGKEVDVSGYGRGEIHDDRGNYGRLEVEGRTDGTGRARVAGGRKEDSD